MVLPPIPLLKMRGLLALGVNIIAVQNGSTTNVSPAADYRIQEADTMVVLGDNFALETVQKL